MRSRDDAHKRGQPPHERSHFAPRLVLTMPCGVERRGKKASQGKAGRRVTCEPRRHETRAGLAARLTVEVRARGPSEGEVRPPLLLHRLRQSASPSLHSFHREGCADDPRSSAQLTGGRASAPSRSLARRGRFSSSTRLQRLACSQLRQSLLNLTN